MLSLVIWLPIIIGCGWWCFNNKYVEKMAIIIAIFNVLISFKLLQNFDLNIYGWQFIEHNIILPEIGFVYSLGIDGLALSLIILSNLINLIIMVSDFQIDFACGKYKSYLLILNGMLNGLFSSTNALLFYIFFEGMLIPLFFIISSAKTTNSIYAALKFFLYAFFGSLFFFIAIMYLRNISVTSGIANVKSLDLTNFYLLKLDLNQQIYLFIAFFIAFSVKTPVLPLHGWLSDAHVESPTSGSIFLSALGLKIGSFAMFRFLLPITYNASHLYSKFIGWSLLVSILYIGFITIVQKNFKRLIAYYSIIHMAFITLGMVIALELIKHQELLTANISLNGAMFQMLSNGLITTGMLFALGILRDRVYIYEISQIKGLIYKMPFFSMIFMFFCLAYVALPGTSNFVGKFLIILSSFKIDNLFGCITVAGFFLPIGYLFWNYQQITFGKCNNKEIFVFTDLTFKESIIVLTLISLILFLGVYPFPILNILNNSAVSLIQIIKYK